MCDKELFSCAVSKITQPSNQCFIWRTFAFVCVCVCVCVFVCMYRVCTCDAPVCVYVHTYLFIIAPLVFLGVVVVELYVCVLLLLLFLEEYFFLVCAFVFVFFTIHTYCCTLQASHMRMARRRLPRLFSAMRWASSVGRFRPSFLHTVCRICTIWTRGVLSF